MNLSTFFDQNGAAIIIAAFGALPGTVGAIFTFIINRRTLENRRLAATGREITDGKIDGVQATVDNGYHAVLVKAADVGATIAVEKVKELAPALVAATGYEGPNRRVEDKGPPEGVKERRDGVS